MKKNGIFLAVLVTTLFSANFIKAADGSTSVLLKGDVVNPEKSLAKDSYFLVSNAIQNNNVANAIKLLDSTSVKENLISKNTSEISDLKKQAQIDSANKLKRKNLRKLLNLAVEKCFPADVIVKITDLMIINKNKNMTDKTEIYSDAKALYSAATTVLENVKNKYNDLSILNNSNKLAEYKKALRTQSNNAIVQYISILKILINTLTTNKYAEICHNYSDFDQTIWKLYKKARELCIRIYSCEASSQAAPKHFKAFLQNYVEQEYKWNKRFLIFGDVAKDFAITTVTLLAITGIFTSLYHFAFITN